MTKHFDFTWKLPCQVSVCVQSRNHVTRIVSAWVVTTCSLQGNFMNSENCFDRFLMIFWRFLRSFLCFIKIYTINFKMKSSTERTVCDNGSCRSGGSLTFFVRELLSLWENWLSQKFLLSLISVKKQLRFCA